MFVYCWLYKQAKFVYWQHIYNVLFSPQSKFIGQSSNAPLNTNMENNLHHSPLYGIRKSITFLHFCFGFPLSVKDEGYTEFIFRPHVEWAKVLLMFVTIVIIFSPTGVVIMKVRSNSTEFEELSKFFNHSGLSSFDIYVGMSFIPINTVSMLCHFVSFKNACTNLSQLCSAMDKTKHGIKEFNITQTEVQAKPSRCGLTSLAKQDGLINMGKIYFCNIVSSGCQVCSAYTVFFGECKFGDWLSREEKALIIISYVVYLVRFGYPLISATSEYIFTTIVHDITHTFEDWISVIDKTLATSGIKTNSIYLNGCFDRSVSRYA